MNNKGTAYKNPPPPADGFPLSKGEGLWVQCRQLKGKMR
jgi:hypothetical protein